MVSYPTFLEACPWLFDGIFLALHLQDTLKVWMTFCAFPAVWASRTSIMTPVLSPSSPIFLSRLVRQEQNSDRSPLNGAASILKKSPHRRCRVVGFWAGWAASWMELPWLTLHCSQWDWQRILTVVDATGRELLSVACCRGCLTSNWDEDSWLRLTQSLRLVKKRTHKMGVMSVVVRQWQVVPMKSPDTKGCERDSTALNLGLAPVDL